MENNQQLLRSRQPTGTAIVGLACGAVLLGVLFWVWYVWAADYGYAAVSGTYTFDGNGEHSTLVLLESRVFQQELRHSGTIKRAEGTWRRTGEGGVVFSKEILKVEGQRVRPDGQADGEVRKTFGGLIFSIVFNGDKGGPVFKKKLFH
jgi:hypothetical protein